MKKQLQGKTRQGKWLRTYSLREGWPIEKPVQGGGIPYRPAQLGIRGGSAEYLNPHGGSVEIYQEVHSRLACHNKPSMVFTLSPKAKKKKVGTRKKKQETRR